MDIQAIRRDFPALEQLHVVPEWGSEYHAGAGGR